MSAVKLNTWDGFSWCKMFNGVMRCKGGQTCAAIVAGERKETIQRKGQSADIKEARHRGAQYIPDSHWVSRLDSAVCHH